MADEAERLVQEDARLVAAAANSGRIALDNVPNWMLAMKADRAGTRRTLASLAPVWEDMRRAAGVDSEAESGHAGVMAALRRQGIEPAPVAQPSPQTVEAATYRAPLSIGPVVDDLGIPIQQTPPPVRISRGKDPSTWTERERQDFALRQLGPAFHLGTKPPPAHDAWYQPGPNDPSVYVEGQGWQPNPNYQPRG